MGYVLPNSFSPELHKLPLPASMPWFFVLNLRGRSPANILKITPSTAVSAVRSPPSSPNNRSPPNSAFALQRTGVDENTLGGAPIPAAIAPRRAAESQPKGSSLEPWHIRVPNNHPRQRIRVLTSVSASSLMIRGSISFVTRAATPPSSPPGPRSPPLEPSMPCT